MTAATAIKEKEENTTNQNLVFINKVKLNSDNTAQINYRTSCDTNAKEVFYQGKDQVTEDFVKTFNRALESFTNVVPKLKSEISKMQMNVIKFDYGKDEYLKSALYSVKYAFSDETNAVMNLNTPALPIYSEGMESAFCISGKDEEALHEIIAKAKAYINGETRTKQMKLVVDNTAEE